MNREIKFRVRNKLTGKIVGYEALFPTEIDNSQYEWCQSVNGTDWTNGVIEGKNLQREQFTGLHDKHGKEIYEADRVRCINKYDEEFTLEVRRIPHLAGFYYVDDTCKEGEWISQIGMYDNGEEVIGDIYSNPELLSSGA